MGTLLSSCPNLNLMTSWERLVVPAMSLALSTCSRRRWLVMVTIPMSSFSRLSWPTTWVARSMSMFQHALRTWGDKMSNAEIDDIFEQFDVDEDYMVKTKEVVGLFVAVKEEEKKEEKKEEVVE